MRMTIVAIALSGCMVGSIDQPTGSGPDAGTASGGGGGGGSGSGSGVGSGSGSGSGSGGFACRNQITAVGDGHHNAGLDCQGSCHNHGFTLSGTIYGANKTTAQSGASITVVDANGNSFDMVSQANGNFYTSNTIAFPVTITASMCPSVATMSATITRASGCNSSSCHAPGGTQGAVHLP